MIFITLFVDLILFPVLLFSAFHDKRLHGLTVAGSKHMLPLTQSNLRSWPQGRRRVDDTISRAYDT